MELLTLLDAYAQESIKLELYEKELRLLNLESIESELLAAKAHSLRNGQETKYHQAYVSTKMKTKSVVEELLVSEKNAQEVKKQYMTIAETMSPEDLMAIASEMEKRAADIKEKSNTGSERDERLCMAYSELAFELQSIATRSRTNNLVSDNPSR